MSERSKRVAGLFEQKKLSQDGRDAISAMQKQSLGNGFREVSAKVKEEFEKQCEELNQEPQIGNILRFHCGKGMTVTRNDNGEILTVALNDEKHTLEFKCDMPAKFRRQIRVKLALNGGYWFADGQDRSLGLDPAAWIVEEALNALLGVSS